MFSARRRLSFSEENRPPPAPEDNAEFSREDYAIAEFEDLNDGDTIYVRWSATDQRAYIYSKLDRPTQWVRGWTLRKTIGVGLGHDFADAENFDIDDIDSSFAIIHREMPDANGSATIEMLNPENPMDALRINDMLDSPMSCPAANKILYMFSVS
jgi:hypothetical protein